MLVLLIFSFVAGIVTILSPCILPILPIILSSSVPSQNKSSYKKPIGVIVGFISSFTFFTLFLSTLVKVISISPDALRIFSVVVIASFGVSMLIPKFQLLLEVLFSKLSSKVPVSSNKSGFLPGVLVGLSLGLLWTPCVGPILASVISLALTGQVTFDAFLITFAYSLGTAIPMFLIMVGGQTLLKKAPILLKNTQLIQKIFGVIMILTALAIYLGLDRQFQTYILDKFPNYGSGLTKIESSSSQVESQLKQLTNPNSSESRRPSGAKAPEIISTGSWFNSDPLTLSSLQGKVVLVDFWTYSCINCIRTLPYLKSWHEKYSSQGLVIIGVHSPEFEFEKSEKNLSKAISDFEIKYPVVQDNDFKTWRAYQNRFWPAKYLINSNGEIVYTHFGEGKYDQTEAKIQELLKQAGQQISQPISNPAYTIQAKTPELYLGYSRIEYLRSPERIINNSFSSYSVPSNLPSNTFAFEGEWLISEEFSNPNMGSRLILNFQAKDVFLVMRTKSDQSQVKVSSNNQLNFPGEDVIDSIVTVDSDRLYKLIKLPESQNGELILEFLDSNTEVYAFTFG